MMKDEIEKLVARALATLKREKQLSALNGKDISVEHPENSEHGDYATNIAFVLGKQLKKNPQEIAEAIKSKIQGSHLRQGFGGQAKSKTIERVEAVGGFVNFYLSNKVFEASLQTVLKQKEKFGKNKNLKGKKIMVEFTDPNPFKEFHIGHLYSNIVGEALCKLFESQGAVVRRANYQGDVGMHVAKAIWGMGAMLKEQKITLAGIGKKSLVERAEFLGKAYAKGAAAFHEDERVKQEITAVNQKVFTLDPEVRQLYQKGRRWSLEYFEEIYKRLGTKFDFYYFERDAAEVGLQLVKGNLKKGIFQESQGAIIFPGEKYGLHSRVFVNSQGLPTYEAKELGLAPTKYKDFKYDVSLIVTGNEIIEYFKVLLTALKQIYPELGAKTRHIAHGMVRLPEGKMSSRTGKVIRGEDLIEEVKSRVFRLMEVSETKISAREKEKAAEAIALGAVKYSLLRVGLGKDIVFDFDKSLSLEGDSGPYLQYTYARCKSILRKARNPKFEIRNKYDNLTKQELDILRTIYRFPEMAQEAAEKLAPNLICGFAFDLAQKYNNFYNTHRVLQAETKDAKQFRLLLTSAVSQLLQNSLSLLGIKTLEKM